MKTVNHLLWDHPCSGGPSCTFAVQRLKALKRGAKREKREAAARDALKEAQAAMPTSPRQAANRLRGEPGSPPARTWQVCRESLAAHSCVTCQKRGLLQ